MKPSYLRLFATTDGSVTGRVALEYCKGLIRIMPVRILGVGAAPGFEGPWKGYERLMTTPAGLPLDAPFINVVATQPERWTWNQRIAMQNKDGTVDKDEQRVEIWTAIGATRNVLLANDYPHDIHQATTARKYDAVIVPTFHLVEAWERHAKVTPFVVSTPISETPAHQEIFRAAVLGFPDN